MDRYDHRTPTLRPLDFVEFGPGLGPDLDRRLIGDVEAKRVLDIGCGAGHTAVGLALRGARVTATDGDETQLTAARQLATEQEIAVEFHHADPAELAFVRADQIDLAISVYGLSHIDDLDRVFRQVHRVLRPQAHLIVALPHPARLCADPSDTSRVEHPWPTSQAIDGRYVHTAESVVTAFGRTKFAPDVLLERSSGGPIPDSLIVRGRRLGA